MLSLILWFDSQVMPGGGGGDHLKGILLFKSVKTVKWMVFLLELINNLRTLGYQDIKELATATIEPQR